jgi:sigma-E factor negative regulatory protein RseB
LRRVSSASSGFVEHLVYSDGLAAVSVFVERQGVENGEFMLGTHRMGAMHAYGVVSDGHRITVIGEVPARTVELIGGSVTRK